MQEGAAIGANEAAGEAVYGPTCLRAAQRDRGRVVLGASRQIPGEERPIKHSEGRPGQPRRPHVFRQRLLFILGALVLRRELLQHLSIKSRVRVLSRSV